MGHTTTPSSDLGAYIRLRQLLAVVPLSPATVWRKVKEGTFPTPVKLSDRVTAWRVQDVRQWLDAAAAASADAQRVTAAVPSRRKCTASAAEQASA